MDKTNQGAASNYTVGVKAKSAPYSSKDTYATASASAPVKRRIIQNYLLLWLDANFDESKNDFLNSMTQLRRTVNTIDIFTDADRCVDYLTEVKDENALMIVSGALGQKIVPCIHCMPKLTAIFVFCRNKALHEQWAKQCPKVKGVFTDIGSICESLKHAARQCDRDTIAVSFVSTNETSRENVNQLDQSFMYTQILKEILFEMDYNEQSIKDLTAYCRQQYAGNDYELTLIAKFEREYGREKSPIWWYTYECFLYTMLNRALRTQEVDTIIKMGFFICHLHQDIAKLHMHQFEGQPVQPFIVYRGQGLSIEDFEKLTKTKGGLMSFNNFLSTSKDRKVSLDFATAAMTKLEQMGILFKMTIDQSISKTPFAVVHGISNIQSEEEVLFSTHTVFRIGDVRKLDNSNRLWQVDLTLTSDSDPLLGRLTERMREETRGYSGWDRLGQLLFKLGKFGKAEEVYRVLLGQNTSDHAERVHLYHMLGWIKDEQGDYVKAIYFHEKSLEIAHKTLPPNHPSLASSYNNIGLVYSKMGGYSKALSF